MALSSEFLQVNVSKENLDLLQSRGSHLVVQSPRVGDLSVSLLPLQLINPLPLSSAPHLTPA